MKQGIQRVLMMHAACMSMEGFVMLSSGDEIGQVNDYNYKKNPDTAADSRYLHRSPFQWENAEKRKKPGTVQYAIWNGLKQMEELLWRDCRYLYMGYRKFLSLRNQKDSRKRRTDLSG